MQESRERGKKKSPCIYCGKTPLRPAASGMLGVRAWALSAEALDKNMMWLGVWFSLNFQEKEGCLVQLSPNGLEPLWLDLIQEPQNCTGLECVWFGASFPFRIGWFLREKAMSCLVLYQVWVRDRDWFRGLSFSPKWSMEIQTALKLFLKLFERVLSWHDMS